MAEVPSHSCAWVRGVVHLFASQGVDADLLLREARVDPERLRHAHERFTLAEFDRLGWIAVVRSGQPTLGLDRTLARRHIDFNISAQAMWSSPDLGAGLRVLSQYLELIHDGSKFALPADRGARWIVLQSGGPPSPRQRVEFALFGLLLLCQNVTHRPLRPLTAEFAFPEPANLHAYRMAFHCPLRFGQPESRMKLAGDDLALPVIGEGESLFAIQDHVIESRLAKSGRGVTIYRASEEIIRRLHLGEPRRENMARILSLTDADFQKRLRSEGNTTFEQLLDSVRKELAENYLKQPGYSTSQVTSLLGWEADAELAAACKRWFGVNIIEARPSDPATLSTEPAPLAARK